MTDAEHDYGGIVQGVVEQARSGKLPREKLPVVKLRDDEFMVNQEPVRATPVPLLKAKPEKFGEFAKPKKK